MGIVLKKLSKDRGHERRTPGRFNEFDSDDEQEQEMAEEGVFSSKDNNVLTMAALDLTVEDNQ